MCSTLDVVIALAKKRTCYLLAPFVKTFKSTNGVLSCKWQENYRHKNIRRGQMKAFIFAKCAKVTLKKCKNAKIVIINHTDTKWYGSLFADSS